MTQVAAPIASQAAPDRSAGPFLVALAAVVMILGTLAFQAWSRAAVAVPADATPVARFAMQVAPDGGTGPGGALAETPPVDGWRAGAFPVWLLDGIGDRTAAKGALWLRVQTPAETLRQPTAILSHCLRDRVAVYLNGTPVGRTFQRNDDLTTSWNDPIAVELPPALVRPGVNEIAVRLDTNGYHVPHACGLWLAPLGSALDWAERRKMVVADGPAVISLAILLFSIGMLGLWIARPKEVAAGWLGAAGVIWWVRNLHYWVATAPMPPFLFWDVTVLSLFGMMFCIYGFAAHFLGVPGRSRVLRWLMVLVVGLVLYKTAMAMIGREEAWSQFAAGIVGVALTVLLAQAAWRKPDLTRVSMLTAMVLGLAISLSDLAMFFRVESRDAWFAFYAQPYAGVLIFGVFIFVLSQRMLASLDAVETLNAGLEQSMRETTARLVASEEARREMVVRLALDTERDRLMREIHDGVGSSLVMALARSRDRSMTQAETEALLQRCLTDLKLTVDSLEPVDGDVAALLASLRHRLGDDLARAGLTVDWRIDPSTPPVVWLDPPRSLHILRIVQEALANVVAHAGADRVTLAVGPQVLDGVRGVTVTVRDNGRGLPVAAQATSGRGLAGMRRRAAAIGARLDVGAASPTGAMVQLWLPLMEPRATFSGQSASPRPQIASRPDDPPRPAADRIPAPPDPAG
jgi:signal transduction histidine kinase